MSPGLSLLVSVCFFMLPMLGLVDEHVQLTTTYHMSPINQCPRHLIFNHTHLVLPSLNNVLPAMVFQNRGVNFNVGCPSSLNSNASSVSLVLRPVPQLGRRAMEMVVVLLLLMSGDVEMNPGPVGEYTFLPYVNITLGLSVMLR